MATPDPRLADRRRPYRPSHRPAINRVGGWLRVGLADVQLIRYALVTVAGLKAADVALRGGDVLTGGWAVAALLMVRWPAVGALAVATLGFGSNLVDVPSNHQTLIGWVGLIFAVGGDDRCALLRLLAGSVYGFAVANKVAGGTFITGGSFAHGVAWPAVPIEWLAVGGLVAQVWLVWGIWRRHWTALPVAAAFHVGVVALMSTDPAQLVRLVVFNGLMLFLVLVTAQPGSGQRFEGS